MTSPTSTTGTGSVGQPAQRLGQRDLCQRLDRLDDQPALTQQRLSAGQPDQLVGVGLGGQRGQVHADDRAPAGSQGGRRRGRPSGRRPRSRR